MASILKVDTITGVTTAGSIAITGEGNSTTTKLQQGLTKAFYIFDGTASTISFDDSFNCSSLADNGTGVYTPNWTNDMASANYSHTCNSENLSALSSASTHVAGSSKIFVMNDSGSLQDRLVTNGCTHGDLA